ncbi:MAG: hypothetical protein HFJ49_04895 [Clostridia bacterium]|jgi:radical SAM protein with 4Fe4S-binding SPASM domain|nr:hypothetical protein [Clostridia bacterium]
MSRIADEIVKEYKIKKLFEKKRREKCTNKKCKECKYETICTESETKHYKIGS